MSENESLKLESMRAGKRGRPQENEETEAIQGSMKERNGWWGGDENGVALNAEI